VVINLLMSQGIFQVMHQLMEMLKFLFKYQVKARETSLLLNLRQTAHSVERATIANDCSEV
jgi:hypothetical protein